MTIGCVVLAAGAGTRFGGDKLTAPVNGSPLIEYILDSLPARLFHRIVVVTANSSVIAAAEASWFRTRAQRPARPWRQPEHPHRALKPMADTDACMFCVADQPLLRNGKHWPVCWTYMSPKHHSHGVSISGQSGNPVIYPSGLYGELQEPFRRRIRQDRGLPPRRILLRLFHVSMMRHSLPDIDTREDLKALLKRSLFAISRTQSQLSLECRDTFHTIRYHGSSSYPYRPPC